MLEIEITQTDIIEGGIQVFARAWRDGVQIGFGKNGSVDIERFRIFNPPVLVSDVNGSIERTNLNEYTGLNESYSLRDDPEEATLQVIEEAIGVMVNIHDDSNIIPNKVGNTTDTFYGVDTVGLIHSADASWATLIAGAGTSVAQGGTLDGRLWNWYYTGGTFKYNGRTGLIFETGGTIPDGSSIDSATLSVWPQELNDPANQNPTTNVYDITMDTPGTWATGDYDSIGSTELSTTKAEADLTAGQMNDFVFNTAGKAQVSSTGDTYLAIANAKHDIGATAPSSTNQDAYSRVYTEDYTGTTRDPKLVVEHTPGTPDVSLATTAQATAGISMGYFTDIAVVAQATASMLKRVSKSIASVAQASAGLVATTVVPVALAVTAQATVALTSIQLSIVTLAVTASATVSLSLEKSFERILAVTAQATGTVAKTGVIIFRTLAVTANATVNMVKGLTLTKTLSAIATAVVSLGRDSGYTDKYPTNEATYQDKYPE